MAGSSVIGALRVTLGADTAAFDSGLKGADKSLQKFQQNLNKVGAAIGVALGTAVVGLTVAIGRAINSADELGKAAQKIGIPVEELSKLKHAADLSGVSMESLQRTVRRLAGNMSDAATNATSQAARSFTALGISVTNTDGTLKSTSQVITEVAGRFATMQDGAGKTAIAMNIFGRAGADLIPMLNAGKTGLNEMMQEAEQLGLVISGPTAKAAEQFNDNLTRLGRVGDGVAIQLASAFAAPLAVITNMAVEYLKTGDVVGRTSQGIILWLQEIVIGARAIPIAFEGIGRAGAALGKFFGHAAIANISGAADALRQLNAVGADVDAQFAANRQSIQDFNDRVKAIAENMATASTGVQTHAAPMIASTKSIADNARIGEQAFKAFETSAKAVFENTRTPLEEYKLKLAELSVLLQRGGIDADTFARAQQKAAEKAGFAWQQQVPSIAGSFAEIASSFGKSGSKLAKSAAVLSAFQALVATYAGSAEALKLPFPLNLAASAAVLAKGLALVASIKGFAAPKFATGGSMRLNNVGSGPDSQLLQARVRPDEQVDIWRPGEGPDPRRGAGGGGTVIVPIQGDVFTRPVLERWIDAVNGIQRDGAPMFKLA